MGLPVPMTNGTGIPPANWTQVYPAVTPAKRAESMMTFDAADGYFVMFGGHHGNTVLGDTW
jgi:hypothetical protein